MTDSLGLAGHTQAGEPVWAVKRSTGPAGKHPNSVHITGQRRNETAT
jgi:hypothetical protein